MAGCPLRPATDRRLGGPLPRQLANQTRAPPIPSRLFTQNHAVSCAYAVLAAVSGCYPPVWGRLPTRYSPVRHSVKGASSPKEIRSSASFDLHVLSTPPAFILSQDQTLMLNSFDHSPWEFWLPLLLFLRLQLSLLFVLILFEIFQGYFTVQLSWFVCRFCATARL